MEVIRIRGRRRRRRRRRRRVSKEDVRKTIFSAETFTQIPLYTNLDTIILKCPRPVFKDLYLSSNSYCTVLFPAFINGGLVWISQQKNEALH